MDDETLQNIYEANSISALKEKVSNHGWDFNVRFENKDITSFYRKGEIGNYKIEMDSKSQKHFVDESTDELKYFDYI